MKLIIAIINPEKLKAVQGALKNQDIQQMTVSDVFDCQEQASPEIYRGREVRRLVPKYRLELAIDSWLSEYAIEAIKRVGGTKVLVLDLDESHRLHGTGCESTALAACS